MKTTNRAEEVAKALAQVVDPETGLDIMRMDLIHGLEVSDSGDVSLVFRPSSPVCPMAYPLGNAVKTKVQGIDWVKNVTIKVENFRNAEHLESLLNAVGRKAVR